MRHLLRSTPARLGIVAFAVFFTASLISRLALLVQAAHDVSWGGPLFGALATGMWYDAAAGVFAAIPWLLLGAVLPSRLRRSRAALVLSGGLMTVFVGLLIFITTAEWFFWDEFGARFNFIAVDYLIWTQEVLGNITESYPMVPIIGGIVAMAGGIVWLMFRKGVLRWALAGEDTWLGRIAPPVFGLVLAGLAVRYVNQSSIPAFANQYHGELAKNGCWSFMAAFKQMELDYEKWYRKLPKNEALAEAKRLLATPDEPARSELVEDLHRKITGRGPEKNWNVMLICMESMSGSYMSYAGGKEGLTPCLDKLAKESLFFDNLYATGTRTVRGMEALTLNLPPTPGQAIIYRPEGTDLTTTFTPFIDRGYDCAFFYGGDGRFDFMNRYYSTGGCRIMDVNAWKKEDVTMKTSWGACDEDMFRKAISEADADDAAGKPFHYFCMTTSNHRPYDFPDGRIDMKSHSGRRAAVKYSDWAIGYLLDEARKKPWFNNTLFVIVSDHCASSAGKSEIDVTKYRIPAMVYNPGLVPARTVSTLCSQIDLMPTVFGMLNWNHDTLSYGHDLLAPSAASRPGRAFVSNYQKIALLTDDGIAILKPNRKVSTYSCDRMTGDCTPLDAAKAEALVRDATVYYQSASWLFGSGGLKRHPGDHISAR